MREPFEKKAWVEFERFFLVSSRNLTETPHASHEDFAGRSPLTELIDRIYGTEPSPKLILRRPIHLNYEPSPLERAYLKIGAKRLKVTVPDASPETPVIPPTWDRGPQERAALNPKGMSLPELLTQIPSLDQRYLNDRPVAALILGPKGDVLATALNSNSRIRTLHAERNLLVSLRARGYPFIPAGSTVRVSLKPCRMCAELLAANTEAQDIRSVRFEFVEFDPGPLAQHTCLDSHLVQTP